MQHDLTKDAARPIYSPACEGIFSCGAFVLIYGKAVCEKSKLIGIISKLISYFAENKKLWYEVTVHQELQKFQVKKLSLIGDKDYMGKYSLCSLFL